MIEQNQQPYIMNQTIQTNNGTPQNQTLQTNPNIPQGQPISLDIYNPNNQNNVHQLGTGSSKTLKVNTMDWAILTMSSVYMGLAFYSFSVIVMNFEYVTFEMVLKSILVPSAVFTLSFLYILFQNRETIGKIMLFIIFILSVPFGIWNLIDYVNATWDANLNIFAYQFVIIFMISFPQLLPGIYALIRILQMVFNNTKDKLKDYDILTMLAFTFVTLVWGISLQYMFQFGIANLYDYPTELLIIGIISTFTVVVLCPIGMNGCLNHEKPKMLAFSIFTAIQWIYIFIYFVFIFENYNYNYSYITTTVWMTLAGGTVSIFVLINALRPQPKHLIQQQQLNQQFIQN